MSTSEERYISPRRLNDFKTLLESEYKIDKHSDQIKSLLNRGAKNLLKITATSKTINGVTFTVNEDQTVTVNGTNTGTGSATFVIVPNQQAILIPDGDYQFLGCPQGGSSDTFDLRWFHYSPNASAYDTGSGAVIHKSGNATDSNIAIVVKSGVTVNNIVFKPMLCTVEDYAISPEFVPYAKPNYELTKYVEPVPRLVDAEAKNLLKITATSQTINGVTFTVNDDGTVTTTGTSDTNGASIVLATYTATKAHELVLSGTPLNDVGAYIDYIGTDWTNQIIVNGGSAEDIWSTKASRIRIVVPKNVNVDGLVFKPMLCTFKDYAISPEFVPYAPTNRELYEMIGDINTVLEEVL